MIRTRRITLTICAPCSPAWSLKSRFLLVYRSPPYAAPIRTIQIVRCYGFRGYDCETVAGRLVSRTKFPCPKRQGFNKANACLSLCYEAKRLGGAGIRSWVFLAPTKVGACTSEAWGFSPVRLCYALVFDRRYSTYRPSSPRRNMLSSSTPGLKTSFSCLSEYRINCFCASTQTNTSLGCLPVMLPREPVPLSLKT